MARPRLNYPKHNAAHTNNACIKLLCASVLLLAISLSSGCTPQSAEDPEAHSGTNASDSPGIALFETHCAGCHMQGSLRGMDRIVPTSPRFKSLEAFQAFIRKPSGMMPAFSPEQLSDADLNTLYTALHSEYDAP
ncbi:MAG: cytochrome c [Vampirovibrionales bacterium]|nr:cytochrome c [Vampirovibrionales bacterium]